MPVPRSLMTPDCKLIPGHEGKSKLTNEITKESGEIAPMPTWIESGNDLAMEFLRRIDECSENADTVAIAFDTYRKVSLKHTTRDGRKPKMIGFQDPISNNHEEADTLIINILCILRPINRKVVVHSVDTDVFVVLLRHHEKIHCETLYMNLVSGLSLQA